MVTNYKLTVIPGCEDPCSEREIATGRGKPADMSRSRGPALVASGTWRHWSEDVRANFTFCLGYNLDRTTRARGVVTTHLHRSSAHFWGPSWTEKCNLSVWLLVESNDHTACSAYVRGLGPMKWWPSTAWRLLPTTAGPFTSWSFPIHHFPNF